MPSQSFALDSATTVFLNIEKPKSEADRATKTRSETLSAIRNKIEKQKIRQQGLNSLKKQD